MKIGSRTLVETPLVEEVLEAVEVVGVLASSSPSPLVRLDSEPEFPPRLSPPEIDPDEEPVEPPAAEPDSLAKASWTAWLSWALLIVGVAAAPADASRAGVWPAKRVRSSVASSRLWEIRSIDMKEV